MKPDLPDQAIGVDYPGLVVIEQSLHPALCSLVRQGTQVAETAPVHAMYFGIDAEAKARRSVISAGSTQADAPALQDGQFRIAHGPKTLLGPPSGPRSAPR